MQNYKTYHTRSEENGGSSRMWKMCIIDYEPHFTELNTYNNTVII